MTNRRRRTQSGLRALPHGIQGAWEVRLDAPVPEVRARLLDPLDLPRDAPALALFPEPAPHDLHHGVVELGVEAAALAQVLLVPVLEPAMRVQVPTKLEQQVEGEFGAGGEGGEAVDVRKKLEHAGGEGGGREGVVEVVLEAVEVEVHDCDFAVQLCV